MNTDITEIKETKKLPSDITRDYSDKILFKIKNDFNLSNYTNGFYTVALVCNGQIVDAKTLVKQ